MSNEQALKDFAVAREQYIARRFGEARTTMQRYRQAVDFSQFKQNDQRMEPNPEISVIVVGYATGTELIDCLKSVFAQQGPPFEVILVDNGNNESVYPQLAQLPILWITPPINLLPSEGRNLGAHFARSDLLLFLDDDAVMASGYLATAQKRMVGNTLLGLRGRIAPKTPNAAPPPKHYDLGDSEKPTEFNLEGNMVIHRSVFQMLGGFDPLMFGHEGKGLTHQGRNRFPCKEIRYCPELVIHHDWAQAEQLTTKKDRQALGKDYLDYLKELTLNAGVSIIVRAGDNLAAAQTFLSGLARHNSYKPVEVLLWAKDTQQALTVIRPYLANFLTRVLPESTRTFGRIAQTIRYENSLIVDVPTSIQ
jgi:glycosyltransferase involved in cell wall biosynthesis